MRQRGADGKCELAEDLLLQQLVAALEAKQLRLGITQRELARRTGMLPSALNQLLRRRRGNPTMVSLIRVAAALGLELQLELRRK